MRLIDADSIKSAKYHDLPYTHIHPVGVDVQAYEMGWNDALDAVADSAPTVDAVPLEDYKSMERTVDKLTKALADAEPVVRCKDCKWGTPHPEGDEYTKCFKLCTTFFSGHYCAWGKRKEDAENKEFTLYADKKPIVTFKDSKIILLGERRKERR